MADKNVLEITTDKVVVMLQNGKLRSTKDGIVTDLFQDAKEFYKEVEQPFT